MKSSIWNLGTLAPGAAVTVTAWTDMQIVDSGQLSTLDAIVTADGGRQTLAAHTVAIDNDTALMVALTRTSTRRGRAIRWSTR